MVGWVARLALLAKPRLWRYVAEVSKTQQTRQHPRNALVSFWLVSGAELQPNLREKDLHLTIRMQSPPARTK
jgi:hypothetical protein